MGAEDRAHDQATGQLDNADEFRDIIVAYRNGAPVHLRDVGRVTDDVQNNKTASWYNGEPRDRARGPAPARARTRSTWRNRVKAALAKIQTEIPPTVKVGHALRPLGHDPRRRCTT